MIVEYQLTSQTAMIGMNRFLYLFFALLFTISGIVVGCLLWNRTPPGGSTHFAEIVKANDVVQLESAMSDGTFDIDGLLDTDSDSVPDSPALVMCIERDQWQAAGILLKYGASPYSENTSRRNALLAAVRLADLRYFELLKQHGADLNRTNSRGITPLTLAIRTGNSQVVKALIDEFGVDPSRPEVEWQHNRESDDPLTIASAFGRVDIVMHLLSRHPWSQAEVSRAFRGAVRSGEIEIARLLVGEGADIEMRNDVDETPLMIAAASGQRSEKIVKWLLGLGADPDVYNKYDDTALKMAVRYGTPTAVEMLLKATSRENVLRQADALAASIAGRTDADAMAIAGLLDRDGLLPEN